MESVSPGVAFHEDATANTSGRRYMHLMHEGKHPIYFQLPRSTCAQIAPELIRIHALPKKKKRLRMLYRFLQINQSRDPETNMRHIMDIDRSERFSHGIASRRIYESILSLRDFDLYGNVMREKFKSPLGPEERQIMKEMSKELGIDFKEVIEKVEQEANVPRIFDDVTLDLKAPVISTAKHKIGFEDSYNPPVGFAKTREQLYNSYGNEIFYAYDGDWKNGEMEGTGLYKYLDGGTYKGEFKHNRRDGVGHAEYTAGSEYKGDWKESRFSGRGYMKCLGGSEYEGDFVHGRREGHGRVDYTHGLIYEGEFNDGKPHGHGTISSEISGYAYQGNFNKGSIEGTGVLITPDGERHMYFWPETPDGEPILEERTLASIVRHYLKAQKDADRHLDAKMFEFSAPLNATLLKEYVARVRFDLHKRREEEKKKKFMDQMRQEQEQREKLIEARKNAFKTSYDSTK